MASPSEPHLSVVDSLLSQTRPWGMLEAVLTDSFGTRVAVPYEEIVLLTLAPGSPNVLFVYLRGGQGLHVTGPDLSECFEAIRSKRTTHVEMGALGVQTVVLAPR